jgi:hypothetical protein
MILAIGSFVARRRDLFGCFGGLIDDQYRNVVANWINAAAGIALQTAGRVGERTERCLALWTHENVEQIFRYGHEGSGGEC